MCSCDCGLNNRSIIGRVKSEKFLQIPSGSASAKQNRMETDQSMNMTLSMPSLKFLTFITFIINSFEKETTGIRLVVKAARQCLGIHTIYPEMIHTD